jgi:glycogen(starch) synthase
LAAAEAMAAGRPVVVTSTTGVAKFVRDAQAGGIVPPGDAKALADAMRPYLLDPARAARVGERGRLAVMREMDADKIASVREQVYKDAIKSFHERRTRTTGIFRRQAARKYA